MSIHFYKLQTGGNGFILIDTQERQNAPFFTGKFSDTALIRRFSAAAVRLCSKRYGIGGTGLLFLRDDTLLVFDARGRHCDFSADAFLCAARYLFDSGRANGKVIEFTTRPKTTLSLSILGSCDFRLSLGSPFSLETGAVITPKTGNLMQTLQVDKSTLSAAGVHIQDDVIALFSSAALTVPLRQLLYQFSRSYPDKSITAAVIRSIQQDTSIVHCTTGGMSSSCAAAASAVVATVLSGSARENQIVYFEDRPGSVATPTDTNGITGRRLGVTWEQKENTVSITGSGAYLFDGTIDIPEFAIPEDHNKR